MTKAAEKAASRRLFNRTGTAREGNKPGTARRCKTCHYSACRCRSN